MKNKVYYHRNEGPYCGCWSEGWVIATPEATKEEILSALIDAAEELSEMTYELNKDENEFDEDENEEEYLNRDSDIAMESSCEATDFDLIEDETSASYTEIGEYGTGYWNKTHTVWTNVS